MALARDRRPLPLQARDEIAALIAAERLAPGDQLPTEAELVVRLAVARTTVREALKLLEQDGVIHVVHGVGRFVAPTVARPITRLESVTEMTESLGFDVTNRVLSVKEAPATAEEAEALGLAAGAGVIRLERLRLRGEEPLIYSVDVIPAALLGDDRLDLDWSGSLGRLLADRGHAMATATAHIRAVTLGRRIARRIGWPPAAPWLLMAQVNFTREGTPIIYSHDYHRGDVFTFDVLRRAEPAVPRSQP